MRLSRISFLNGNTSFESVARSRHLVHRPQMLFLPCALGSSTPNSTKWWLLEKGNQWSCPRSKTISSAYGCLFQQSRTMSVKYGPWALYLSFTPAEVILYRKFIKLNTLRQKILSFSPVIYQFNELLEFSAMN